MEDLQYDLMHTKHLGVDCYYLGSILTYLVQFKMGGEPSENVKELWEAIRTTYQELRSPSQFSNITLNMFKAGQAPFPCLKGKASEVKHLVPVLERVCADYLETDIPEEKLMLRGLQQSRAIDACIHDSGRTPRCGPKNNKS